MKRLFKHGLFCLFILYATSPLANVTPNVSTCDELIGAMENGDSIYLSNNIDCNWQEIKLQRVEQSNYYDSARSPVFDGNGYNVSNITLVTRTGILNPTGISRNVRFDGVHYFSPMEPTTSNPIVAGNLQTGGYIKDVEIKNISSNKTLTGLFDDMRGTIDGLTVDLGTNKLVTYNGVLTHIADGYISDLKIINGELSLKGHFPGMLVNAIQGDGSYTNIYIDGLNVTGSFSELGLIGAHIGSAYINGIVYKNISIENPSGRVALVVASEDWTHNAKVLNYEHDFWADWAEPLYPDVLRPSKYSTSIYETKAVNGEPSSIPSECSVYLKQDYYWKP